MSINKSKIKPLWTGKTLGTQLGHKSLFILSTLFGRTFTGFFLIPVTLFYYFFIPGSRKGSKQFFKRIFPYAHFLLQYINGYIRVYTYANTLLDKVYFRVNGTQRFKINFPDTQNIINALKLGKGVIILSAHIGSWEIVSRFFKRFKNRVNVVIYEGERPEIKNIYMKLSQHSKMPFSVIYSNDPLDALLKIRDALLKNEIVVMHGDRTMGKGISCNFLGKLATFPALPYSLAAKYNAPIVVAFGMRLGKLSYKAVAYPHFSLQDNSSETIKEGLIKYTLYLTNCIKKYPFQWYNFYNFWDTHNE